MVCFRQSINATAQHPSPCMLLCVDEDGDSDDDSATEEGLQAEPGSQQEVGESAHPEVDDDSEGDGGTQGPLAGLQQQEDDDDSDGVVDEAK